MTLGGAALDGRPSPWEEGAEECAALEASACDEADAEDDVGRGVCVCTSSVLEVFATLQGLWDGTAFTLEAVSAAPFPWIACMYLFRALLVI